MKKYYFLTFAFAAMFGVQPLQPAKAEGVNEFFKTLEGSYRGRGSVNAPGSDKAQKVSCSVKNAASGSNIKVSGSCATTRGKGRVNGSLKAEGSKITGSFISPFPGAVVLGSNGVYKNGRMAVITIFKGKNGDTIWLKQQIDRTKKGFNARFSVKDKKSGKYNPSGSLKFTKR